MSWAIIAVISGSFLLLLYLIIHIVHYLLKKKYGTPYRVMLLHNRYNVLETYYCQNEEKANKIYEQLTDRIQFEEGMSVRKQKISIWQYILSTK